MATALQNRIVGSVILIALAVIILPELLDGKPQQQREQFETMPLQPEVEVTAQEVKTIPAEEEFTPVQTPAETVEVTAVNAPTVSASAAEQLPPPDREPTDVSLAEPGWTIQLGVFSNPESVDRLIATLTAKGYPAYSEKIQRNGRELTKLMVGPGLVQSELEAQLPALKKLTQLNGEVIRFEP